MKDDNEWTCDKPCCPREKAVTYLGVRLCDPHWQYVADTDGHPNPALESKRRAGIAPRVRRARPAVAA